MNADTAAGFLADGNTDFSSLLPPNEYLTLGPPVPNALQTIPLAKTSFPERLQFKKKELI